jgi:hypothetical protein
MGRAMKETNRDMEVLGDLAAAVKNYTEIGAGIWVRPLDCGGFNGSDHSYRLGVLARLGLAERKRRGGYSRGSWKYTITEAGHAALAKWEAER